MPTIPIHIRWLLRSDLPEVLAIEHDPETFSCPWDEEDFLRCLRARNCIGMVAEDTETHQIMGYMAYELHKDRLEILNFAVHPDFRRRGIGARMIAKLVAKLSPQRRNRIVADVRESNLGGHLFFRDMGFRACCVVHQPWPGSEDDAYRFQCCIQERVLA